MRKAPVIDKYSLFEQLDYKPHSDGQRSYHDSTARFRVPCCGRRWGKSMSTGHDMTAYLFTPEARYWIVGPTYDLAEKEFRVVYHDLYTKLKLGPKLRSSYNVKGGDMRIEMPWGTILEVKSADKPKSLVGEGLDGVVMSEAAKHASDTWSMYIEPALSDKRGWADFPSTPQGYNWFQGLWQLGQEQSPDYIDYESWQFPSWTNTAAFPLGRFDPEIVRIERTVSKPYFDQEYGALFTSFVGQIYEEFDRGIHVRSDIEFVPNWKNYWAIDFGFSAPFVCLDIMVDPEDNVYVWRE